MKIIPEEIQHIKANNHGQMIASEPSLFSFFYRSGSYMVRCYDSDDPKQKILKLTGFVGHIPYSVKGGVSNRSQVMNIINRSAYLCGTYFYVNNYQMILFTHQTLIDTEDHDDAIVLLTFTSQAILQVWPVLERLWPFLASLEKQPSLK